MSPSKKAGQSVQPQPEKSQDPSPQPANQQYFDQPQTTPVQYVVTAESLKGVKGWLMFFTICFILQGFGMIGVFFGSMTEPAGAASVVSMIFAPFIAAAAISAVVLISMGKKLGKIAAITAVAIGAIFSIAMYIVDFVSPAANVSVGNYYTSSGDVNSVPTLIMNIVITLLIGGLLSLYFINSRRVKETLVN